jgi:hypothetical protein
MTASPRRKRVYIIPDVLYSGTARPLKRNTLRASRIRRREYYVAYNR